MTNVAYSGKMIIGGSGIGTTAHHQVRPLMNEGLLKTVYAQGLDGTENQDIADITHQINVPQGTGIMQDLTYDGIVSLVFNSTDIDVFQTWGAHSLFTMQNMDPNIVKIVNLYSAHIKEQAKILNGEMGINPFVHPLHVEKISRELELADYIFIPSEWVYKSLQKHGLEHKAKIVPFGVDLEKFNMPAVKSAEAPFRAIFVGRAWIRKGLLYLLEAWKKMPIDAELLVISQVPENIKPAKNVKFETWVDDLVIEYQHSDVFVLPALEDGCPLVTYEAMACGLPAVVSDNTGTSQHIWNGQNGFITPTKDVSALADKLLWLYNNRDSCIEMGRSARKMVEAFPWERHEKEYIKWIKSI